MGKRYILDLVPGMVLSKTIFSPTGQVLLEEGRELGVEEINSLLNWGVNHVWVMGDDMETGTRIDRQKRDKKEKYLTHYKENVVRCGEVIEGLARGHGLDPGALDAVTAAALADLMEDRDVAVSNLNRARAEDYMPTHMVNVSTLAMMMANRMQLSDREVAAAGKAGLLHDAGMRIIDQDAWRHERTLTDEERAEVQRHVELGVEALEKAGADPELTQIVRFHHERLDGSGYPGGLSGDEVPVLARIVAVADVYDALTSTRPYRAAIDANAALRVLINQEGGKYDQAVLRVFLSDMAVYPIGCVVKLNTGETGVVVGTNPFHPFRPVVKLIFDAANREIIPFQRLDLDLREHWKFYITEVRVQTCLDDCSFDPTADLY